MGHANPYLEHGCKSNSTHLLRGGVKKNKTNSRRIYDVYINEHKKLKIQLINAEDEKKFALKYYETNDVFYRNLIVQGHQRFLIKLAHFYSDINLDTRMDLIQEANLALIKVIDSRSWDPEKSRLLTYAGDNIKSSVHTYLFQSTRIQSITDIQSYLSLAKFFNEVDEGSLSPEHLVRKYPNINPMHIKKYVRNKASNLSLDQELETFSNDEFTYIGHLKEILASNDSNLDDIIFSQQITAIARKALESYSDTFSGGLKSVDAQKRALIIFERRILPSEEARMTLEQVGLTFGVSKGRARDVETRVIRYLKQKLIQYSPIEQRPNPYPSDF
jgi:RNA polymerase sigma factor (sigma-70 family)